MQTQSPTNTQVLLQQSEDALAKLDGTRDELQAAILEAEQLSSQFEQENTARKAGLEKKANEIIESADEKTIQLIEDLEIE